MSEQSNVETYGVDRDDIPEKPAYVTPTLRELDDHLEAAIECAEVVNNDYLATLLTCELGSYRLQKGIREEEPEWICPVCQYIVTGEEERQEHANDHPGVKPDAFTRK